jgi:hypothetical protein
LCVYICHYIFPFYYLDIFFSATLKKKCPNNKKEIYNDKYKHTRDRLFGLVKLHCIFSLIFTSAYIDKISNSSGMNELYWYLEINKCCHVWLYYLKFTWRRCHVHFTDFQCMLLLVLDQSSHKHNLKTKFIFFNI